MPFGHAACLPRGRAAQAFDPALDITVGNLVAIALSDADAEEYGRRFDIARVKEITHRDASDHGVAVFAVVYYECDHVVQWRHPLDSLLLAVDERAQLDGRWVEGAQMGEVTSDNVICEAWIEKWGACRGLIHPAYKRRLEEGMERLYEL